MGVANNLVKCHLSSQVQNPQLSPMESIAKVGVEQLNSASNFGDLRTTLITVSFFCQVESSTGGFPASDPRMNVPDSF